LKFEFETGKDAENAENANFDPTLKDTPPTTFTSNRRTVEELFDVLTNQSHVLLMLNP
jgi:hypothetical protein